MGQILQSDSGTLYFSFFLSLPYMERLVLVSSTALQRAAVICIVIVSASVPRYVDYVSRRTDRAPNRTARPAGQGRLPALAQLCSCEVPLGALCPAPGSPVQE